MIIVLVCMILLVLIIGQIDRHNLQKQITELKIRVIKSENFDDAYEEFNYEFHKRFYDYYQRHRTVTIKETLQLVLNKLNMRLAFEPERTETKDASINLIERR